MLNRSYFVLVTCIAACQVGEPGGKLKAGDKLLSVPVSPETRAIVPSAELWNVYQTSAGNHVVATDKQGTTVAELETITEHDGASTIRAISPQPAEQHIGPDGVINTFPQAPTATALRKSMETDLANAKDAPYYSCWEATIELAFACQSSGGWSLDIGGCCCQTLWYQYECYDWWFDSCEDVCYF